MRSVRVATSKGRPADRAGRWRHAARAIRPLPDLLGIGATKAGPTPLYADLLAHPGAAP